MAPPFIYNRTSNDGSGKNAVLKAALDGNLGRLKGVVKSVGDPKAIFSFDMDGFGVLHCAACQGHLEVCKYLVEELGVDGNAPGARGTTPFMASAQSGDVPTVKYFLERGCDPMKIDGKGWTALHHAAGAGCCKVTEFLLSKGVPVDIDCGCGTPLIVAANNEQDKTLKILLQHHANPNIVVYGIGSPLMGALVYRSLKCMKLLIKAGADVNGKGSVMTPLLFATMQGGYTNFVQFLLKAGADPNIPDDLGRLPIELAASRDCKEEVEMLFPLTSPIPTIANWSIDEIIRHAKNGKAKPMGLRYFRDGPGHELKLVGMWSSPYVTRVKLALHLKGLSYDYVEEDLSNKSELLLSSNPVHKTVPVLIHGGKPVCEPHIIVQYIDEAFPDAGPSLLPADPHERAAARFWAAYVDDKVLQPWRQTFMAKTEEERAEWMKQAVAAVDALEGGMKECSHGKEGFFGGDSVGYVDVLLGAMVPWVRASAAVSGDQLFDAGKAPLLAAWMKRFEQLDAAKAVFQDVDSVVEYAKMIQAQIAAGAAYH